MPDLVTQHKFSHYVQNIKSKGRHICHMSAFQHIFLFDYHAKLQAFNHHTAQKNHFLRFLFIKVKK